MSLKFSSILSASLGTALILFATNIQAQVQDQTQTSTTTTSSTPISTGTTDCPKCILKTPDQLTWNNVPGNDVLKIAFLEGDAKVGDYRIRLTLPAGTQLAPHWHPAVERITVISGTLNLGFGKKFDQAQTKAYPSGSFISMPTGVVHFAWVDQDTIIQMSGKGKWESIYLNPADKEKNLSDEPNLNGKVKAKAANANNMEELPKPTDASGLSSSDTASTTPSGNAYGNGSMSY